MRRFRMIIVSILVGLAAPALAAPAAAPPTFSGRGIYYFEGGVRCPFAGLGSRGERASNRLALDDAESRVTIDREHHRISVLNTHAYPDKSIIVDLTFLGTATVEGGQRVPIAVHLKVEKKKTKLDVDLHPHWTVRGALTNPDLETFDVVVSDGASERTVATAADLRRTATESKILYTLAGNVVEVQDNLERRGPSLAAGGALADLSLGFGTKRINKMLLHAELRSLDAGNAALAGQDVPSLLTKGAWQLRLTALSSLLSQDTLRRDLFMLGLDGIPIVAEGMKRGLAKGETLAFTFRAGRGRVAWGGAEADLPAPLDVARAFLEFNFLGAVLARQAQQASATLGQPARPAAAPPSPQKR